MARAGGTIDLGSGTGLVIASTVGTGVLVSNGYMLADLAPWQIFAVWVLGALMASAGAVAYGAISAMIPRSGGEYRYLSELYHPALGYLAGWISLLVGFAAPTATAAITAGSFAEEAGVPVAPRFSAVVIIAVVTSLQMGDMRTAKWSQNLLVIVKFALFFALIAIGFFVSPAGDVAARPPVEGGAPVFAVSLLYAIFAFSGWNASIYAAEEFARPKRDVALSMVIGLASVTALYLVVTHLFIVHLQPSDVLALGQNRERSVHVLVSKLLGSGAASVVSVAIVFVLVSLASATMFVGPRVNAAMARDGYLPHAFATNEGRPSRVAFLFQGGLAVLLVFAHSLQELIENVGIMLTLTSALTVLGLVRFEIRRRRGKDVGPSVSTIALISALAFSGAAAWMLYFALRHGHTGLFWIAAVTAVAMLSFAVTRWSQQPRR